MNNSQKQFLEEWDKMDLITQDQYLSGVNEHVANLVNIESSVVVELSEKVKEIITNLNYQVTNFNEHQLECIQELVNRGFRSDKFINPGIASWVMNSLLFAIDKDDRYAVMLDYIQPSLNFGTLEKIMLLNEQNNIEASNELIYVWTKLDCDQVKKLKLQNLIMRGIQCKNMYADNSRFEEQYKFLNANYLGLEDKVKHSA